MLFIYVSMYDNDKFSQQSYWFDSNISLHLEFATYGSSRACTVTVRR
jgi:hypothetical protein